MPLRSLAVWVGGAVEDGPAAAGEAFLKACARSGLHAFAYHSRPAAPSGGHALFQSQVGLDKVWTQTDACDVLVALNQDTLDREAKDATFGVLYDSASCRLDPARLRPGAKALGLPDLRGAESVGALLRLTGLDLGLLESVLPAGALRAGRRGFEFAGAFPLGVVDLPQGGAPKLLLDGNRALGLGALAAGCRFFAARPTGAAGALLGWLADRAGEVGILVQPADDEGAAAHLALGASHAGVRAMCAASGAGFGSMAEAVGLAGMAEVPLVVVLIQRAGPGSGLATKGEQGDLFQALGASQGEFPKAVLAPLGVEDAVFAVAEAFNLAEKHQAPALVLADLALCERLETVDSLDLGVPMDRGVWARAGDEEGGRFLRYKDSLTGVSPRAAPGQEGLVFVAAGGEHDEAGRPIGEEAPDPFKRIQMVDKRMRKLDSLARDLRPAALEGPRDAELTLVGWGSNVNLMRLVMEKFNRGGMARVNILAVRSLWPFPFKEVAEALYQARKVLAVETNQSAQLCRLIRMETGFYVRHRWLKYDGEPFYPGSTFHRVQEVLQG